jgi:hypothetical protein
MELLGDSGSFFQANVLSPDALLFLLPRLNFRSGHVPSLDATVFYEWVVTKQEPSVNAVFSEQSCLKLKRVTDQESVVAYVPHYLPIVRMNCATDHVHCPIFFKGKAGVFPRNTVGVNPIAIGCEYHNHLGDEVHKLLKFLLSTLTLVISITVPTYSTRSPDGPRTAWPTA